MALQKLGLGDNEVTNLPEIIFQPEKLESLYLLGNYLTKPTTFEGLITRGVKISLSDAIDTTSASLVQTTTSADVCRGA